MGRGLVVFTVVLVASSLLGPLPVANVHAIIGCTTTCYIETDTNVPASVGPVIVRLDNITYYPLNRTFSFTNGTFHTIEVMNITINQPSTGARYVFKQWTLNGVPWNPLPMLTDPVHPVLANYTSTQNGALKAEFEKQFPLTLSFSDPAGKPLSPPSSITLQGPSRLTLTSYSLQWVSASVWTVQSTTWQGVQDMEYGTPTVDVTSGPTVATVPLKAYNASIRVTDNQNAPISGATITVTFVNATTKSYTTDSQGWVKLGYIPLGPYTAHIVYQNQDEGSYPIDASSTPESTIKLAGGAQSNTPIVSALVLLTIFGIAIFLLVLAVKVRKPPPPPAIG